jgi:hypothetical protein
MMKTLKNTSFNEDDQVLAAQQANRANAEAKGMTAFAKSYVQNVAANQYWEIIQQLV